MALDNQGRTVYIGGLWHANGNMHEKLNSNSYACIYVRPDSQPLTRFEAGQRIQFQNRSDLNWLAVLTESVYKLEMQPR